jgi:hypothetical protein
MISAGMKTNSHRGLICRRRIDPGNSYYNKLKPLTAPLSNRKSPWNAII